MKFSNRCLGLLLLGATSFHATVLAVQSPAYKVEWVGAMRDVLVKGDLSNHIALESLAKLPHLYALGPVDGLTGEITIMDGVPWIARIKNGKIVIDKTFKIEAPFLVWVQVEKWQTVSIPHPSRTPPVWKHLF